ncbi:hypothetical protein VFPPC_18724 [Pochonia chlamydosporia 170]|uniref:Uncharacterized protein n=1 Tax=Pochonia chlamydosporia 170 TaxID=1380566 RepID=A0A219ASI8_METCM|nr:hypothetical protein VFPPC_18724 [Pochonia chlamydosporia 170]OWT43549.1 hypothetical protein VFPPC_18724 [Pochonia chlamydosporia 170]
MLGRGLHQVKVEKWKASASVKVTSRHASMSMSMSMSTGPLCFYIRRIFSAPVSNLSASMSLSITSATRPKHLSPARAASLCSIFPCRASMLNFELQLPPLLTKPHVLLSLTLPSHT